MKKNKRDNAKTPTNNTYSCKTQPHTPKKNIEHARARAQAQKRKFVDPQYSLTISHEKLPQKLNHKKKTQLQENSTTNISLTQNEDQSKARKTN
jgi:hypothetical protein